MKIADSHFRKLKIEAIYELNRVNLDSLNVWTCVAFDKAVGSLAAVICALY